MTFGQVIDFWRVTLYALAESNAADGNKVGLTVSQSLNILVVDDEVNITKTVSVCLKTEGHKVIAVFNFKIEIYYA